LEFALISQKKRVVSKDAVISCSWDWNNEASVHVVREFKLKTETHRSIERPTEINF